MHALKIVYGLIILIVLVVLYKDVCPLTLRDRSATSQIVVYALTRGSTQSTNRRFLSLSHTLRFPTKKSASPADMATIAPGRWGSLYR